MLKVAVIPVLALSVTVQGVVPLHPPPDHPAKDDSVSGVAVRVICVPVGNDAEQVLPQSIPACELDTAPVPVPALATDSVGLDALPVKGIDTVGIPGSFVVMVTVAFFVPTVAGEKVTPIVHDWDALRVWPVHPSLSWNCDGSLPPSDTDPISIDPNGLPMVIVCDGDDVPVSMFPRPRLVGV